MLVVLLTCSLPKADLPASAGWYPEPGGNGLQWWDGFRWTDARHGVSPPVKPHS